MYKPLIGLVGVKQSGKDTVAQYLVENYGYKREAFADTLKQEVAEALTHMDWVPEPPAILAYMEKHKTDPLESPTGWCRQLLQAWGLAKRDLFGESYWVDQVKFDNGVVLSDCRFISEANAIKDDGGLVVRIVREGLEGNDRHPSETELEEIEADYTVCNNGPLEHLYIIVDAIMEVAGIRKSNGVEAADKMIRMYKARNN